MLLDEFLAFHPFNTMNFVTADDGFSVYIRMGSKLVLFKKLFWGCNRFYYTDFAISSKKITMQL